MAAFEAKLLEAREIIDTYFFDPHSPVYFLFPTPF
jgi:hypothetical protein